MKFVDLIEKLKRMDNVCISCLMMWYEDKNIEKLTGYLFCLLDFHVISENERNSIFRNLLDYCFPANE